MHLVQEDKQIQVVHVAIFLIFFGSHMNILLIENESYLSFLLNGHLGQTSQICDF